MRYFILITTIVATTLAASANGRGLNIEASDETLYNNPGGYTLNWDEICVQDAAVTALFSEGDRIVVTVSAKNANESWPKVVLRDASSISVKEELLNQVSAFPYDVVFALAAEDIAKLTEGMRISGAGVSVTKVVLRKAGGNDEPGDNDKNDEPDLSGLTENVLWTGDQAISWSTTEYDGIQFDTYAVKQDMFAGLESGNYIKIVVEAASNAEFAVDYKAGENWTWTTINDIYAQTGDMMAFKTPSDNVAGLIAERGIVIKGIRFHLRQISVWGNGSLSVIGTKAGEDIRNNGIPYNILGQPVNENYKGIIIRNGKKYVRF